MQRQLKLGKDTLVLRNQTIRKLYLDVEMESDAVNTGVVGIDLRSVSFNITIYQGGVKTRHVVYALPSMLHAYGQKRYVSELLPDSNGYSGGIVRRAQSASLTQKTFLRVPILNDSYILKGDDRIEIVFDVPVGCFDPANDSNSVIYVTDKDGSFLGQTGIGVLDFYPLLNNETPFSRSLGDNVKSISIIAANKAFNETESPFTEAQIESNTFNETYTFAECHFTRIQNIGDDAAGQIVQLFNLPEEASLDNCSIQLDTVVSNLTEGYAYLVVERFESNRVLAQRNVARKSKHIANKQMRTGYMTYRN